MNTRRFKKSDLPRVEPMRECGGLCLETCDFRSGFSLLHVEIMGESIPGKSHKYDVQH